MAEDKQTKSSLGEGTATGLKPETALDPVEEVNPANDLRSLDLGESGQFAPGGYYNQQGATRTDRLDLDEQVASDKESDR
ncbi:MAG: hypothetical protein H0T63_04600 [Pyrinomonadaceae bacterium]|nr:hypothetical protein [Pyrinomonadaceae bacterium]MDQ3585486.1 hypothetical protein [Acidobacteriota bacterium]